MHAGQVIEGLPRQPGFETELYRRSAAIERVSRTGARSHASVGQDEGSAVRVKHLDDDRVVLNAVNDHGIESVREANARCLELLDRGCGTPSCAWPAAGETGPELNDEDPEDGPTSAELGGWLREATDCLDRPADDIVEAWIEASVTTETWGRQGGFLATRRRARAWAMVRIRGQAPAFVASRNWDDLSTAGWKVILDDRPRLPPADNDVGREGGLVLFAPEAAASLALALADVANAGDAVGPAWRVEDLPGAEGALFGGTFDDVGFPTRRRQLADGHRCLASPRGPGHFRRPSYRDAPESMPCHLSIDVTPADTPSDCLLVSRLAIYPTSQGAWLLGVTLARLDHGRPVANLGQAQICVEPKELLWRCVATLGPVRCSHRGVATPALLFEGLEIQS